MNKLFLMLILVNCIGSCQEKNKTNGKIINKTNDMKEKFDIAKYNKEIEFKEKLNDINLSLSDYEEKKQDGTRIMYSSMFVNDYNKASYSKQIYPRHYPKKCVS